MDNHRRLKTRNWICEYTLTTMISLVRLWLFHLGDGSDPG